MMTEEFDEIRILSQHPLASIIWPVRTPKEAIFKEEFADHIRHKFNEPSVHKYAQELEEFARLRNIAISTLSESSRGDNSLKTLKKYYWQLVVLSSRFKDCGALFSWKDSLGRGVNEGGLDFEINNIMYNIAAIHNEIGSREKMIESSTRSACLHFSNALWWVTELRDNRSGTKCKEMGHDLLTFFHHVLQAQAQECLLSHSIKTIAKPETVAMIANQVANDYDIATKLAVTPLYADPLRDIISGGSGFSAWKATVDFKHKYFSAMTQLLSGLASRDDNAKEIGTRVARLKLSNQIIEQCKKLAAETVEPRTTQAAFAAHEALITRKLEKAIRFNDNVYHASIPSRESLAQIEAKLLILPVPFNVKTTIPEFRDIFSGLVTIESVQVNSIYSEKKDNMSRDVSSRVAKQDEELAHMMSTLNIDKRTLKMPTVMEAPDELIEICAELSMDPNIVDDVLTKLEELDDKSEEIQKMLDSIQEMLRRHPNRQFEEELNRYRKTQEDAMRTTQSLHKQLYPEIQQKIQLMATTRNPVELLPKYDGQASSGDDETIKKLEKLLDKVDEMKQQRSNLVAQLRQSLNDDDVIKYVVAAPSEQDLKSVFDQEIQKHKKFLDPLESNLKMQNEILDALERVNAQYGQVKLNYRTQKAAYAERVESLKKFYAQFKTTSDGIEEGLKYHSGMLELVKKFHQKVMASNDLNDLLN